MNQKKITTKIEIDEEVAEIVGAFIGDGWIQADKKAFYITGNMSEDKDYYDNYLANLFTKNISAVKPKAFSYWKVYGISCYKKEVITAWLGLGLQSGLKALTTKIPQQLLNKNDDKIIKAVLRGIFDADGSFWCEKSRVKTAIEWKKTHHYSPRIQISSCSKELLEQINQLLIKMNFNPKLSIKNLEGIRCGRNVHNSYALRLVRLRDINRWFESIGSNNPKHLTKYTIWKKWGYLPPRTNLAKRKEILLKNII